MQNNTKRVSSKLALLGGLIHIAAAVSILFLSVFRTCGFNEQGKTCYGESYIQLGGNALGYGFLLLMILAGITAIYSSFIFDFERAIISRGLVILASMIVIVIAGSGFGIAFIPGALLAFLAILIPEQRFEVQK